jgi:hypothetical protein
MLAIAPNPFNSTARIVFTLPQGSEIKLRVFDVTGRLVETLVDGRIEAGEHEVRFESEGLASGVYIARLETGKETRVQKMVLMK